jgi:hypothetical protein
MKQWLVFTQSPEGTFTLQGQFDKREDARRSAREWVCKEARRTIYCELASVLVPTMGIREEQPE